MESQRSLHHFSNSSYFDNSTWMYDHEGNSSITTSVTIRVTPEHYYLVSWSFLWVGFVLAIGFASFQVHREYKWMASRSRADLEQAGGSSGDGEAISSADITRSMFRRLLLVALIARTVLIPVQIWADPLWIQFVADTLPEMAFASAWTLLVSFFVQLVGVASGTGTSTMPGLVMQLTAYVVYVILIVTSFWNYVACVLLYALLCCVYAALFGTSLYFCPRLLQLLQPSLVRHSGLAIRLATCSILCILVFGGRTFGFARKVIVTSSNQDNIFWWWQYGALELVPSVIFLVMMHPQANRTSNAAGAAASSTPPIPKSNRRAESPGPSFTSKRYGESAPLVKPVSAYGSASALAGDASS